VRFGLVAFRRVGCCWLEVGLGNTAWLPVPPAKHCVGGVDGQPVAGIECKVAEQLLGTRQGALVGRLAADGLAGCWQLDGRCC